MHILVLLHKKILRGGRYFGRVLQAHLALSYTASEFVTKMRLKADRKARLTELRVYRQIYKGANRPH